jgi:hypothetical protein
MREKELQDKSWYWIKVSGVWEVARYDKYGWSHPTWDRVATDELTFQEEVEDVGDIVERNK